MSAVTVARDAGALVGAAGIAALMVPIPRLPATPRRVIGLALSALGWIVLALTLVPSSIVTHVRHLTHTPIGLVELVVGAIVIVVAVVAVLAAGTWAVLRWPTAWFAALAIALPIRVPIPIGGASRNLLLPLYLVGACGILAFVWGRLHGRFSDVDEPRTPIDVPIAGFICLTLLSMLWTIDSKDGAIQLVFFYIPFPLLFLTVVAWWSSVRRAIETLTIVTIGFATAIAALALVQYEAHWIFWNAKLQQDDVYSQFYRVNGIFFDPNIMGRYLAIGIVAALGWMWVRSERRDLIIGTAAIVVMSGGLLVSFSRSSCLLLMTGIALLAWRAFGARRTLAVGGIAFVILAGGAIASSHNIRSALTSSHRLTTVSEGRFGLMTGGFRIWKIHPIAGSGVGSFQTRFTATETVNQIQHKQVSISHNAPITVLAELGAIGFALFIWLCVATWHAIAASSRRTFGSQGWVQWCLLAVVTGIFVHSQLYADLFEDPMAWTAAGGALAIGLTTARSRISATAPSLPPTE